MFPLYRLLAVAVGGRVANNGKAADVDRLLTHFIEVVETGEIETFLEMLADDV